MWVACGVGGGAGESVGCVSARATYLFKRRRRPLVLVCGRDPVIQSTRDHHRDHVVEHAPRAPELIDECLPSEDGPMEVREVKEEGRVMRIPPYAVALRNEVLVRHEGLRAPQRTLLCALVGRMVACHGSCVDKATAAERSSMNATHDLELVHVGTVPASPMPSQGWRGWRGLEGRGGGGTSACWGMRNQRALCMLI